MAFQSVPETAEIVIAYTGSGANLVNVLAARLTGGYTLPDLEGLAAAVDAIMTSDWLPIQTDDVSYVDTTVRGLESLNDLEAVVNTGAAAGTLAEVGSPGNVTLAVKKLSGFTGRSARGRMYWIGMPRSNLAPNLNQLDVTAAADIVAAVEALRAAIVAEGWLAVIVSRISEKVLRDPAVTFTWTSTGSVNIDVDSQRRRLLR